MTTGPRLLRPVGTPFGLYFRPGRNDHRALLSLIAEGASDFTGLVLDACLEDRQMELRTEARRHGLETILDTRAIDLATPGGIRRSGVIDLPWAGDLQPHRPELLGGLGSGAFVTEVANHVADHDYTAVLAPTHYLQGFPDPWFEVDRKLTRELRLALDARGCRDVCIYYPLAIPGTVMRDPALRKAMIARLSGLPIDGIWLRVHPFGTTSSGPLALRRYIEGCREFQTLGVPLVAEHTGTIGVALLAFGAVGGIGSGVTYGERFDVGALLRPPSSGSAFSPSPRVYIASLGAFLTRKQARKFFENRQMRGLFACHADGCCRRGAPDMEADPKRHFLLRRAGEVNFYSRPPEPVRAGLYLEEFLRPATDLALRAARVDSALEPTRKRLEGWRQILGAMHAQGLPRSSAVAPQGHRIQPRQEMGA